MLFWAGPLSPADGQVRVKVMEKVAVTIQPLGEGWSRES